MPDLDDLRQDVRDYLGPDGQSHDLLPDRIIDRALSASANNTLGAAISCCDWFITAAAQSVPVSADGQSFDFSRRVTNWQQVKVLLTSQRWGSVAVGRTPDTTAELG